MFMKCKVTVDTSHYPKEGPWELPEGWCWCKLEELCVFLSRGKSPVYSETSKEYPVFAQKCNLKEGGISLEKALFLNPSTLPKWPKEYRLKTGDVLVNSTGTGTVGRTRLFNEQVLGPYPFVVPDSHVSVIRTFNQISSEYVFILLSSEYGQNYFADNLAGSTNQKELYIASIAELQVPLPPIEEQRRIAEQVFTLGDIIKKLDEEKIQIQSFVNSTKAKILELAIHGKLVQQDSSEEPAIELLMRINPDFKPSDNLHYGTELPDGWQLCHIQDIASAELGKTLDRLKNTGEEKSYLCTLNVKWEAFDLSTIKTIRIEASEKERYAVRPGDLLVCEGGDVGRSAIWTEQGEIYYQNALHRIRFKTQDTCQEFFLYVLRNYKDRGIIDDVCKGVTIKHFTGQVLRSLDLPFPPVKEQARIVKTVKAYYNVLDEIVAGLN